MSKVLSVVVGVWRIVARYPAISAGIGNVLVVVGAALGLHFTTGQLATTASVVAGIFGVLVHAGVIPLAKAKQGDVPEPVAQAVLLNKTTEVRPGVLVPKAPNEPPV